MHPLLSISWKQHIQAIRGIILTQSRAKNLIFITQFYSGKLLLESLSLELCAIQKVAMALPVVWRVHYQISMAPCFGECIGYIFLTIHINIGSQWHLFDHKGTWITLHMRLGKYRLFSHSLSLSAFKTLFLYFSRHNFGSLHTHDIDGYNVRSRSTMFSYVWKNIVNLVPSRSSSSP